MNNKMLFQFVVLFVIGLIGSPSSGVARIWEIDKELTNFCFSVQHIYSKVHRRFTDCKGFILFDPDNLKESKISFETKVKSIDTGISKRDRHSRSKDFLNSSKYPLNSFAGSTISKAGENSYNVNGKLTIKGVSTEVILPLRNEGSKDHPFLEGTEVSGFNGQLSIDRLDYEVGDEKYYQMGGVGKDVDILVTIEVLRKK